MAFGRGQVEAVPDKELLLRHAQGDPYAFSELVARHRDRMWAVALRTIGDPEEAADALQDAFLSAYRAAGRFRGDAAVTTWLHRIVVNACLDRLRRRTVRPTVNFQDEASFEAVAPKGNDPTSAHEVTLDVTAALAQIPYEQRAALILVDMMGYAVEDAARVLEVPPGTIKSRCARGRARLAPLLLHLRNRSSGNNVGSPNVDTDVPVIPRQGRPTVLEEGGGTT
ncbi:RNA polymerase sigma factor SigM [Actinocorallia longicatena]|uniref:RNA polymerase sigma factor SigM n=1 Tax=Actinocorallia longicatena TaxID=111803 RepID=A0ABP6QB31_9ACTN